jgi:hypothetical protein
MQVMENQGMDFTYTSYKNLVSALCKYYKQVTFAEGKNRPSSDTPLLILRHDIDMSLEAALRMARLEADLGIKATYFFYVRCPLYNMFSGEGAEQVQQILDTGHHLGLHFDCALYQDISPENIDEYVARESELIECFFKRPVEAVSFHRPGPLELKGVELKQWPNSYERVFQEDYFEYFSDSRGKWGENGNPIASEAFSARKNLHILTHPIWWTEKPMTPKDCLVELMEKIGVSAERYLHKNCDVWNNDKPSDKQN